MKASSGRIPLRTNGPPRYAGRERSRRPEQHREQHRHTGGFRQRQGAADLQAPVARPLQDAADQAAAQALSPVRRILRRKAGGEFGKQCGAFAGIVFYAVCFHGLDLCGR